jgi:hypothetical protein
MTPLQRQAAFDRLFTGIARRRAKRLGVAYAGKVRKLPPPPLPGEKGGSMRYFLNAVDADGRGLSLVELGPTADAKLRSAQAWAETGAGRLPVL